MEEFSWQTEFREFTNEDANFGKKIRNEFIIKKLEINEDKGDSWLVTLEDQEYKIRFEITKGTTILNQQDLIRLRLEGMNQLLNALHQNIRRTFK